MRRILSSLTVLSLVIMLLLSSALAQPRYPEKRDAVNDAAAVLSKATVDDLTTLCKELANQKTLNLYVVTVDFLDGYTMTDYAEGLQAQWKLGKKDLLLLLCVGEDRYTLLGGKDVNEKLAPSTQRKLLATYLDDPFMRQQYDTAIAALMPALVTEINKVYHEDIDVTGLFGISSQAAMQQDWLTNITQRAMQAALPSPSASITDEDTRTGFSLGKVILTVFLLMVIFGNHGASRRRDRRGCGCGCAPLSSILAGVGLWKLWKDD